MKISVFIADDHELIREAAFEMFSKTADFECTGQASNGTELLEAISAAPKTPDICLLDLKMPYPTSREELIVQLKKLAPSIKIVIFSSYLPPSLLYDLIVKIDVDGYILKEGINNNVIRALRLIMQGEKHYSPSIYPEVIEILKKEEALKKLTKREKDTFELIRHNDDDIAKKLGISPTTVRKHINGIKTKLNFEKRSEIRRFGHRYFNTTHKIMQNGIVLI